MPTITRIGTPRPQYWWETMPTYARPEGGGVAPSVTGTGVPWNLNAAPQAGQGAFGSVPGAIGLPPVYNDVAGVFPNLSEALGGVSDNILSELRGELDPNTIAMLQNTAAQYGIGRGVPLSPFSGAQGLRHLGQTVEERRRQGISDLTNALPALARTLTVSPETQLEVANRNALFGAAPNPTLATLEAQRRFNMGVRDFNTPRSGGGGGFTNFRPTSPAEGTGMFAPGSTTTGRAGGGTLGGVALEGPYAFNPGGMFPEGGAVATPGGGGFQDWFNDPFIGGGGGMFGMGPGNDNSTSYWNDWFGFDDFGTASGDTSTDLSNWDWDWMAPTNPIIPPWEEDGF